MIVVDGNDGTGKSTLVNALRQLGYEVADRGLPTHLTDHEGTKQIPTKDCYVILDAPVETCQKRLAAAGKDLSEQYHTVQDLTYYRERFRKVAEALSVPLVNSGGSSDNTLEKVLSYLQAKTPTTRIGIPKGRLFDDVVGLMERAGYGLDIRGRNYHPACKHLDTFVLKPRAVPQMIALGLLDLGFCGRDLVEESGYSDGLDVLVDTGLHPVKLWVAAERPDILSAPPKRPLVVATEYTFLASRFLMEKGLSHICIQTWGSTEAWAPTYADIVVDVVETGTTMEANGLVLLEQLMESTLVLIGRRESPCLSHHHGVVSKLGVLHD